MTTTRLALAALALVVASPAGAAVVQITSSLTWAVAGGLRQDGKSVCALVSSVTDNSGGKIVLEHISGTKALSVRLIKSTWEIPTGTRVSAALVLSGGHQIDLDLQGSGHELQEKTWIGSLDTLGVFLHTGYNASVIFKSGSEKPWPLAFAGEAAIEPDFIKCLQQQAPAPQGDKATQPF